MLVLFQLCNYVLANESNKVNCMILKYGIGNSWDITISFALRSNLELLS